MNITGQAIPSIDLVSLMDRFGAYKIIAAERLIVEYHSGNINIDDFIGSRKMICLDKKYSPDFDTIFDFRDANMLVDQPDIKKFVGFFKGNLSLIGKRKSAYITSKPNQVAITTIFAMEIEDVSVHPMTFSTLDGVVEWIDKKNINLQYLSAIIEELKSFPFNIYPH